MALLTKSLSGVVNLMCLSLLVLQARAEGGSFDYKKVGTDFGGLCATGIRQSPINIVDSQAKLKPKDFGINYQPSFGATITAKGISFEVKPDDSRPCFLRYQGQLYKLLQLHAHAVSEHSFNGQLYPLEIHFVHQSTTDPKQLLVLGTFFSFDPKDTPNLFLESLLRAAPTTPGATAQVLAKLNYLSIISPNGLGKDILEILIPTTKVYTYPGSLTTPGCDEVVTWLVIEPEEGPRLSVDQWERFQIITSTLSGGVPINNRPPQPLGSRNLEAFLTFL